LPVHRNAAAFKISDRPVGTPPIDGEYFVEGIERELWHIVLAAL
jgi:hypothetical protein